MGGVRDFSRMGKRRNRKSSTTSKATVEDAVDLRSFHSLFLSYIVSGLVLLPRVQRTNKPSILPRFLE